MTLQPGIQLQKAFLHRESDMDVMTCTNGSTKESILGTTDSTGSGNLLNITTVIFNFKSHTKDL